MHCLYKWLLAAALIPAVTLGMTNILAAGPVENGTALQQDAKKNVVHWVPYEKGMTMAKTLHKKVYLLFFTDNCRFCKMMDSGTLTDRKVIEALNKNFVPIRVNSNRQTRLASSYMVRGLPTAWFLEEDGSKIGCRVGYVPPKTFLNLLDFVASEGYK